MAVSPLNNPLAAALGSLGRPLGPTGGARPAAGAQAEAVRTPAARPQAPAAALRPQQPLAGAAATAGALPAEPPAGTDPALWSVLTGDERAFFAKAAASGPLTYGRISAGVHALQGNPLAQAPMAGARGARLDVRA
jgi:hypothetical protein